ncbi:MAG: ABC transporter ATP-binding protein [bacterium]|nr:ABC transporter ATP-binding protein [bacterium]
MPSDEAKPTEGAGLAHGAAGSREWVIEASGISKRFRMRGKRSEIWALRDVSFEVAAGEAVGIVGRNGAGKSTLLEIIAGTRTPTEGRGVVRGRVAALLQLGAGFHPDFTGRENVFLSGSIQGFGRAEVESRFDEIAAFADIGHFLEEPVKTYSSGMYARLAFAVATAFQPDILIVDEILAVGDAPFQQKCVTRIERMRSQGATLLFVSHSVDRVNALCDRSLLLEAGRVQFFGETAKATDLYLQSVRTDAPAESAPREHPGAKEEPASRSANIDRQTRGLDRYGSQEVRLRVVEIRDANGRPAEAFDYLDEIVVFVRYESSIESVDLNVSFLVRDETGVNLCGTMTWDEGVELSPASPGDVGEVSFRFVNRLRPGRFGVSVAVTRINREDHRRPILYDQIDGVATFLSHPAEDRPIHYKFDAQIGVEAGAPSTGRDARA